MNGGVCPLSVSTIYIHYLHPLSVSTIYIHCVCPLSVVCVLTYDGASVAQLSHLQGGIGSRHLGHADREDKGMEGRGDEGNGEEEERISV